jgi:multiple antibiotic resistance protein
MTLGAAEIFILFFVTLGPLKIVGPFAHATSAADATTVRQIGIRAFVLSTICVVAAGFIGSVMLSQWRVSLPAMTLTGGIILFLVALRQLLQQYEAPHLPPAESPGPPMATALKLTFPVVLTPYGLAAVIVLFAASTRDTRVEMIVAMLLIVMVLNLLAMLYAHRILNGPTVLVLRAVGAVLGVLQVALSVQIMIFALRQLGIPLQ